MRLALAQMVIKWHNIDVNLEKCLKFIEEAVKNNVDFIVFPEMCLTGYTMKIDRLPDDETYILDWFKDKAKKYNINIMATKRNGKIELTITPDTRFTGDEALLVLGKNKDIQKCFHI